MSDPLPWDILLARLPEGYHYQLPPRRLGGLRFIGLFLVLGAPAVGGVLLLALAAGPAWPLAALVLGGVWLAVRWGQFLYCGHSQIHLRGGRLLAVEHGGLCTRRRALALADLRRLRVAPLPGVPTLSVIVAEYGRGRRRWLAPGYPVRLLAPLARDLARRCHGRGGPEVEVVAPPTPSAGWNPFAEAAFPQTRLEPPPNRRITLTERDGRLTVVAPAPGFWSDGPGPFALGYAAFLGALSLGVILMDVNPWLCAVWLAAFWLLDLGLLLTALRGGRRREVLEVSDAALTVTRGRRRQSWPREDLTDVCVGPGERRADDGLAAELHVHEFGGSFTPLLAGHDVEELAWVATRLRRALAQVEIDKSVGVPGPNPMSSRGRQSPSGVWP